MPPCVCVSSLPLTPACRRGSRSSNHESRITAAPALPCAGGHPPQRPPVAMPPCVRDYSLPPTPACLRGSRSSNHESRLTAAPALPCAGGHPPQRPPVAMPPCVRVSSLPLTQRAGAAPAVRITNHESRITTHGRPGPPLCRGTPPATPPCSDAAVRARRQLAADPSVPARLPQFESRITNHESRPSRAVGSQPGKRAKSAVLEERNERDFGLHLGLPAQPPARTTSKRPRESTSVQERFLRLRGTARKASAQKDRGKSECVLPAFKLRAEDLLFRPMFEAVGCRFPQRGENAHPCALLRIAITRPDVTGRRKGSLGQPWRRLLHHHQGFRT